MHKSGIKIVCTSHFRSASFSPVIAMSSALLNLTKRMGSPIAAPERGHSVALLCRRCSHGRLTKPFKATEICFRPAEQLEDLAELSNRLEDASLEVCLRDSTRSERHRGGSTALVYTYRAGFQSAINPVGVRRCHGDL